MALSLALVKDTLFVANTDALIAFPYKEGQKRLDSKGMKVLDLPRRTAQSLARWKTWIRRRFLAAFGHIQAAAVDSVSAINCSAYLVSV